MLSFFKFNRLDPEMQSRIGLYQELLANTKTVPINLWEKEYEIEYLIIPAMTKEGEKKTPIFNYPGGLTDLSPCIEPFLYIDRVSIHISPLGYGKSSDIPSEKYEEFPLHGALVSHKVLQALEKQEVVIYGHSNASVVTIETVLKSLANGIKIKSIILVNPLGLRWYPRILTILAHSISGALSRILSWRYEHPFEFLKDYYRPSKHLFSMRKILYEVDKSSVARLPKMFHAMKCWNFKIPITVIQSDSDWGRFHLPWKQSNEEILRECIPPELLNIIHMSGLHNVTLGKDSEKLAKILKESV